MLFTFYIIACIGNAIVTIVAFFLYVKARLADRTEARHSTEAGHAARLAELVLILIHLSNRLNGGIQH